MRAAIMRRLKIKWELFRAFMVNLTKASPNPDAFWDWLLFVKRRWHELTSFIGQRGPLAERTSM
jgi:hypothetical protein